MERRTTRRPWARWLHLGSAAVLALAPAGCGREFFRKWADQDVTEAVFEKSRDPRWNLPAFSVDPPALSRFAQWGDPDRPPAPPDDPAAEALSPVPQKPNIRLMVPAEGTGYLDQLEQGRRYEPPPEERKDPGNAPTVPPIIQPEGGPPPASAPGPFRPEGTGSGENPGTGARAATPNTTTTARGARTAPGRPSPVAATPRTSKRDDQVLATAFQDAEPLPALPIQGPGTGTTRRPDQVPSPDEENPAQPGGFLGTEGPPPLVVDPNAPPITRPDLSPDQAQFVRERVSGFAAVLSDVPIDANEALVAGLPSNSRPYVMNPAQALQLALVNSRAYQYNLEQIYIQSLAVTLSRFAFEPQFFAGVSPSTGVAGGTAGTGGGLPQGASGASQFVYRTAIAPGGQASQLSLNTAAGFGKFFSLGGRLLGGFANNTVFNFVGSNPSQPSVQSSLPLSFVQPFLQGGGRAVTLEPLTLAERNLLYEVRTFARFRQEFFVSILSSQQSATSAGAADPNVGYLQLMQLFQTAENARINVASFERALQIYTEYAKGGASSGLSQLQVDQVALQLNQARGGLINAQNSYRNALDQYKQQLGLPPDAPVIPDTTLIAPFRETFRDILAWQARADNSPTELPGILRRIPRLDNVVLDDRPLFDNSGERPKAVFADPEKLEEFLLVAERISLENRLDLMNQRGQLADAWRDIAVDANGLLGIFNVSANYQLMTPSGTNNPFGFNSQSNQFNLTFNTELPLVRVAQRNNLRTSQINYERARRLLMQREDAIKFQVRQEIRNLIQSAENYEIAKANLEVTLRQRDQSLQQIIAPPEQVGGGFNASLAANQATQTINFINSVSNIFNVQNTLIQFWVTYQTQRLALYRDLGIMPYDEWEAYYELFPDGARGTAPEPRADRERAGGTPAADRGAGGASPS